MFLMKDSTIPSVHIASFNEANLILQHAKNQKILVLDVSTADIKTENDLFKVLSTLFKFPDYFGYNWDALDECLRDLREWLPAQGYILVFRNTNLLKGYSEIFNKLVESWLFAAEEWRKENVPFHLIFVWG